MGAVGKRAVAPTPVVGAPHDLAGSVHTKHPVIGGVTDQRVAVWQPLGAVREGQVSRILPHQVAGRIHLHDGGIGSGIVRAAAIGNEGVSTRQPFDAQRFVQRPGWKIVVLPDLSQGRQAHQKQHGTQYQYCERVLFPQRVLHPTTSPYTFSVAMTARSQLYSRRAVLRALAPKRRDRPGSSRRARIASAMPCASPFSTTHPLSRWRTPQADPSEATIAFPAAI